MAESNFDSVDEVEKKAEESGKPSLTYWKSQLDAYDRAAESWKKDVDAAFDEYLNAEGKNKSRDSQPKTHFPMFWAAVRTILPAFYSRTPVIVTEKSFKEMRDPVARLAAVALERLGKYAVREGNFDRTMTLSVTHFVMAEKASNRVIFDSRINETTKRRMFHAVQAPIPGPDGQMMLNTQYIDQETNEPYTGEVQQDEEGNHYAEEIEEDIEHLTCDSEPMNYRDYRQTPNARHQGEIDWISFDTQLTRTETEEAFGEVANELTYGPAGNSKDKDKSKEIKGLPAHYATITEIWDKKKRKVYYLSPGYGQWLKHKNNPEGDDPYKLKNFFPCTAFIMGTHGPEDMFTSPAYIQLQDFIMQVHEAFDRVRRLLLALKKAGVFDSSKPELAELNSIASEGQFIGIADLDTLLGPNGSLDTLIHFFPTEKIAQGVNELKQAMMEFEQKFYDLWGIPDIYRGITDPNETLGAQQLKGKHMSVRFSWLQREVQRLARDTIEIMVDLYLAKCPDQKLAEIMGFQFMTPEEQQIFPQALALLKDDSERCIRLEIETDSTITQNMNADIEQKNYLAKTLFEGIGAMRDVPPPFMPVAAKAVELGVRALQQGKLIEDDLEQSLEQMRQQAAQPPPPPPPDTAIQVAQIKAQSEQAKMQIDAQSAQADSQLRSQELQLKYQELQLKAQELQIDMQLEREKLQVEMQKVGVDSQLETMKTQVDAQMRQLEHSLEASRVEIEKYKAVLDEREKFIEERRLANEDRSDHRGHLTEAIAALAAAQATKAEQKPQQASMPIVHVHTGEGSDGKPRKKKIKITDNDDGTASLEEVYDAAEGDA